MNAKTILTCACALVMSLVANMANAANQSGQTYYIKPHAPENAVIKVRIKGQTDPLIPDMDHKYWLDAYWDQETGVTLELTYATENGYFFVDGSSEIVRELTVTTNGQEIDPPDGTETVRAQAQSGKSYYMTLKQAIDEASNKAKISLFDNVTLEETLTVTNAITLDLATNVVTLGSALTQAFHFKANATIANGTINSTLASNAEGSMLLRFTDCKATLKNLTVNGKGYEYVVAHDSETDLTDKFATMTKHTLDAMTCDGLTLTGNGCLLSVDYASATLTNNCSFAADNTFESFEGSHEAAIYCFGNGKVTVADGTYAAPKVLQSGDSGGKIIVNGGTFAGQIYSLMKLGEYTDLEQRTSFKAQFTFNGGNYADASIAFADADSRDLDAFAKNSAVIIAAPDGYVWEGDGVSDVLVQGAQPESVTPGVLSEAYDDAASATNAASKINSNKATCITVPTGVEGAAKITYLTRIAATATDDDRVVVDLTPTALAIEQTIVDAAVTSETAVAALTSTNALLKATIAPTTPGLYYWLQGGTEVNAITNAGAGVLSVDGGSVDLTKPALDATAGAAFFKIAAGVLAPTTR